MFNISKSCTLECYLVLFGAIWFTGVYGSPLYSSEMPQRAGKCP
jgi:hypothetical protein